MPGFKGKLSVAVLGITLTVDDKRTQVSVYFTFKKINF